MPLFWTRLKGMSGLGSVSVHSEVSDEDQRHYVLPWSYLPGTNELSIYLEGKRQLGSSDYDETSDQSITFNKYIAAGQRVMFVRKR